MPSILFKQGDSVPGNPPARQSNAADYARYDGAARRVLTKLGPKKPDQVIGFADEDLIQIHRFVRRYTAEKFDPVRHVMHEPDNGLVLEVVFEGTGTLAAPQVRRRDTVSAHQPPALGQAARRSRSTGDVAATFEGGGGGGSHDQVFRT